MSLSEDHRFYPVHLEGETSHSVIQAQLDIHRAIIWNSRKRTKSKGGVHPNYHQERKHIDPELLYSNWDQILNESYLITLHYLQGELRTEENILSLFRTTVLNFIRHSANPRCFNYNRLRSTVMTYARNIASGGAVINTPATSHQA